ncbi:MAG: glycerol-3-phosphate 1-O-acyltransferase, partial [Aestuariibacter sp.]|nr:glycerol-3-phosphate 1-O-acyltransferase [Aestuariibacter sp.]
MHRILRWLLFLWVKVEVFPRENPPFDLDPSLPTLYVLADRGLSDLLVLTHSTRQLNLPSPLARISIASVTYHHSVYSIASPSPLTDWIRRRKKHSTMLQDFIYALQNGEQTKLQVVPVSVFWGRPLAKQKHWSQVLFADTWAVAGRIRKFFTLLIHGRNTRLIFSRPLSFELLARECSFSGEEVQKHLLNLLTQQREATVGPRVSHRNQLTNAVINTPEVQQLLEADSASLKKAKFYCREIFADCTQLTIEIMLRLLRQFWRRFYAGIDIYNVDAIKQVALTHQLVYVPCHRSHVDYLLLSYIIFNENLAIPYIASGSNLNMPVIGRILRGGGAFFIRRSFKNNPLYGAVMHAYIEQLITLGVPIEYFIEGGRSRTGRLLKPKLGMLNMTVDAYIRTQTRPLAFVPVYIGYEKLIEGRSYLG